MDQQPKIPTLKDSQKPTVKIRGLVAGRTFMERLRQFNKKEIAFLCAGVGTLCLAPLVQYFATAPETGEASLTPGWGGGKGSSGIFGGGSVSPYEPGVTGTAPGSLNGVGSDVITPLNVRDPSALVMGPGATQQPPAGAGGQTAPTGSPSKAEDYKDALGGGLSRGMGSTAGRFGGLGGGPAVKLGGSGLRGLGVVSGGAAPSTGGAGGAGGAGGVSSAGLAPGRANTGGGLSHVNTAPGYRGVASRGPGTGPDGNAENLKKAADAAGNVMNRGAASTALETAANQAIPTGGMGLGGNGQGGAGAADKGGGEPKDKGSKNLGESLAFMKAKAIQDAQIDRWKQEQIEHDPYLQWGKLTNKFDENVVGKIGDAFGKSLADKWFGGAKDKGVYTCSQGDGLRTIGAGDVGDCDGSHEWKEGATFSGDFLGKPETGIQLNHCSATPKDGQSNEDGTFIKCFNFAEKDKDKDDKNGLNDKGGHVVSDLTAQGSAQENLNKVCDNIDKFEKEQGAAQRDAAGFAALLVKGKDRAKVLIEIRNKLGGSSLTGCGAAPVPAEADTVRGQLAKIVSETMGDKDKNEDSVLGKSLKAVSSDQAADVPVAKIDELRKRFENTKKMFQTEVTEKLNNLRNSPAIDLKEANALQGKFTNSGLGAGAALNTAVILPLQQAQNAVDKLEKDTEDHRDLVDVLLTKDIMLGGVLPVEGQGGNLVDLVGVNYAYKRLYADGAVPVVQGSENANKTTVAKDIADASKEITAPTAKEPDERKKVDPLVGQARGDMTAELNAIKNDESIPTPQAVLPSLK